MELLIYLGILSVLVVAVTTIFISLSKGTGQTQSKNEVNSAIRFANELLRQDLKNATAVTVPSIAGGTSSTLTLTRNNVTITYDTASGVLRRKEGATNPVNVTNSNVVVSTPIFTRIENSNVEFNTSSVAVKINMTFSYNSASPDLTYSDSIQTTINLY